MSRGSRPVDRRVLSPADVDDLLGIKRVKPTVGDYDPTFWTDIRKEVRKAGKVAHQRQIAARVNMDLRALRAHGWYPTGSGLLWQQLQADVADDRMMLTRKSSERFLQCSQFLMFLTNSYPPLALIVG